MSTGSRLKVSLHGARIVDQPSLGLIERSPPKPPSDAESPLAQVASPLSVLHLRQDVLLDDSHRRFVYWTLHFISRVLPLLVIYGGTGGLLVCAIYQYRWGVLLSLTMYSFYMLHLCVAFMIFSAVGIFKVFFAAKENWHDAWLKHCDKQQLFYSSSPEEQEEMLRPVRQAPDSDGDDMDWSDVIHIVMVPTYKTPEPVLIETLNSLAKFSLATTNLGVCLALEEREKDAPVKAKLLQEMFDERFRFMFVTYHPPNLPNHVPGKSSNECWAFFQLCRDLETYGISTYDPRVVLTVIDDDSEMHENYFEALTYYFLTTPEPKRYMSTWQPPICHFKNYVRQPVLVRISSLFSTLHELSCLANPIDCHVPFSSYSLSLALASAVNGWDPEYLAEDWHMYAKCSIMTEGRIRCQPIFLPLMNYTPEEETYIGTLISRWAQAKRHALGLSELVYVISAMYLAILELPTPRKCLIFVWRLMPLLAKFTQVHFVNGMAAVWNVLAQLVIHFYMWRSWCYVSDENQLSHTCGWISARSQAGLAEEQVLLNSWLVYFQQRATGLMCFFSILSGGMGAFYLHLVKDRVEDNPHTRWNWAHPLVTWFIIELEVTLFGLVSSMVYGAAPLWIACIRILQGVRFSHVVASMVGRSDIPEV